MTNDIQLYLPEDLDLWREFIEDWDEKENDLGTDKRLMKYKLFTAINRSHFENFQKQLTAKGKTYDEYKAHVLDVLERRHSEQTVPVDIIKEQITETLQIHKSAIASACNPIATVHTVHQQPQHHQPQQQPQTNTQFLFRKPLEDRSSCRRRTQFERSGEQDDHRSRQSVLCGLFKRKILAKVRKFSRREKVCLNAFIRLTEDFFGNIKSANYKSFINDLRNSFVNLGITMSTKLHYLLGHLDKFPTSLGLSSEQFGERFHQEVKTEIRRQFDRLSR